MIDVLGPEKRRRRTTQEKIAIVQQSFEPGMTVSLVARQHGVAASQLFLWRKQYQEGSLLLSPPENRLFLPLNLLPP
ncbi:transposase [Escherichia coli chi7122]|nr:transposase [Escherichia coli chi7122]